MFFCVYFRGGCETSDFWSRESEGNQLGFGVNRGEAWCSEAVNQPLVDVEDVSSDQT